MNISQVLTILPVMTIVACGSGTTTHNDISDTTAKDAFNDSDANLPADTVADGITDIDVQDSSAAPSCADLITSQNIANILGSFSSEGRIIVHLDATFDGQAVWIVWSALNPDANTPDDAMAVIRAARMGCDGTFLIEPFTVNPGCEGNSWDADIATDGNHVFIVWQEDYQGYQQDSTDRHSGDDFIHRVITKSPDADVIEDVLEADTDMADSSTGVDIDAAIDTVGPDAAEDASDITDSSEDVVSFPNDNIRVYYKIFTAEGTPVMDNHLRFLPVVGGTRHLVNNWLPRVVATRNGQFIVTSTWAAPEATVFQIVAQRFNNDGTESGDLIYPYAMTDQDEQMSSVAVGINGNIHLAWAHSVEIEDAWETSIASMTIAEDSSVPMENSPVVYSPTGDAPCLTTTPEGNLFTSWIDSSNPPNIAVVAETPDRSETGTALFGNDGDDKEWTHSNPKIVSGDTGTVLAWYRWDHASSEGAYRELVLRKLAWNGSDSISGIGNPVVANPVTEGVSHDLQPYYEPVIVDVGNGYYFLMWSEPHKINDEWHYKAFGRFIKM